MKISVRNVLSATVKTVIAGAVDTEVVVELAPGDDRHRVGRVS